MKIKIVEVVNSVESLNSLVEVKMPVKPAYWLSRIIKKVVPEVDIFNEKKNDIIKECEGKLSEDGKMFTFEGENSKKFAEKMKELGDIEIDIDVNKIKISD